MSRPSHFPFWKSWLVASRGVVEAVREQRNLRIDLVCGVVVIALCVWLKLTRFEWIWISACMGAVISSELANTALETAVDLACPDPHDLARKAKDISAGAVLAVAITAAAIGTLILLPRLLALVAGQP